MWKFRSEYQRENNRNRIEIEWSPIAPKGIIASAPARPSSDSTDNPQDVHPATTMPKIVLPPTETPSLNPKLFKLIKSLDINNIFKPTNKELTINKEKSSILNEEDDPIIN